MATEAAPRRAPPASATRRKADATSFKPRRPEVKAAAERLGRIYAILARDRALPLDTLAIPPKAVTPATSVHGPLLSALSQVYGTSGDRRLKTGRDESLYSLYKKDYETVIPRVGEAAFRLTGPTLLHEQRLLRKLHADLNSDSLSDQLHKAARAVISPYSSEPYQTRWGFAPQQEEERVRLLKESRAQLAQKVKEQNNPYLSTLFVHPQGARIVKIYSLGAVDGRKMALRLVEDAVEATADFRSELAQPGKLDRFWRYPGFIWLGVAELGLAEIPGFKPFAAAIGQAKVQNPWERVFSFAGQALALLGLLFMGPLGVPVIVAGAAAGGLVVAGAELGFAYMREREQDLGAKAFQYRAQDQRLVAETSFLGTAMAGAAALLAALAFFQAFKELELLTGAGAEDLTKALPEPSGTPRPPAPATGTASEVKPTGVSPGARGATADTRATTPDTKAAATAETRATAPETKAAATAETRATAPETKAAAPGEARVTAPETGDATPGTRPRKDAVPVRQQPTTPAPASARGTGEPVKPSSRGAGPSERSATPKVAAGRGVRDSAEAAEKRVAELLADNTDVEAVGKAVKPLLADLARLPENGELVKQVREVLTRMRDPKLIARVVAKVKAAAERLGGIPPTELEKAYGLVDAESRAVAELAGFSPENEALFKQTLPTDDGRNAKQFFEGFVAHEGEGWYVIDWQAGPPDHGAMTHIFQDLLLDEAFAEAGILSEAGLPLRGREFRINLAGARGGSGTVYTTLDSGKTVEISIGNQLFIELFDSTIASRAPAGLGYNRVWGTLHRPETLYELLRAEPLPELK